MTIQAAPSRRFAKAPLARPLAGPNPDGIKRGAAATRGSGGPDGGGEADRLGCWCTTGPE